MKRPAFQFYTGDWQANPNLRRCSHEEKGVWVDVLCLMHDQDDYGVLRWPLKEVAQAIGCKPAALQALVRKTVLKGAGEGDQSTPLIFTPRHAGKDGEPVVLIPAQAGPIWYSSRMVRDEYIRTKRGIGTRFGDEPKDSPKPPIGDGPSASIFDLQASADNPADAGSAKPAVPACPHLEIIALYHKHLPMGRQVNPKLWDGTRAKHLQARWREDADRRNLRWWERFFDYCSQSEFLTGKAPPSAGRRAFEISLDWIVTAEKFKNIHEGKYHS